MLGTVLGSNMKVLRCYLLPALTKSWLAMQDMEVIVHAGCQQKVLMGWMPLQPPHSTTHGTLTERLPHVPAIPQQNLLIIAAEGGTRHRTAVI